MNQPSLSLTRRNRQKCPPNAIRRLAEVLGGNGPVADLIGVGASTISEGIRDGEIAVPYEQAAQYQLNAREDMDRKVILATVPADKQQAVLDFISFQGGRFTVVQNFK